MRSKKARLHTRQTVLRVDPTSRRQSNARTLPEVEGPLEPNQRTDAVLPKVLAPIPENQTRARSRRENNAAAPNAVYRQHTTVLDTRAQANNDVLVNAVNKIGDMISELGHQIQGIRDELRDIKAQADIQRQSAEQVTAWLSHLSAQMADGLRQDQQRRELIKTNFQTLNMLIPLLSMQSLPTLEPSSSSSLQSPLSSLQPPHSLIQTSQSSMQSSPPSLQLSSLPQRRQEHPGSYTFRSDTKGNHMTVREAWEEFHGPISAAKKANSKWPYTKTAQRTYQRRAQFVKLLKEKIERDQHVDVDTFLDTFSSVHKELTINKILNILRKESGNDNDIDNGNDNDENTQ